MQRKDSPTPFLLTKEANWAYWMAWHGLDTPCLSRFFHWHWWRKFVLLHHVFCSVCFIIAPIDKPKWTILVAMPRNDRNPTPQGAVSPDSCLGRLQTGKWLLRSLRVGLVRMVSWTARRHSEALDPVYQCRCPLLDQGDAQKSFPRRTAVFGGKSRIAED